MTERQVKRVMVTGHEGYVGSVLCPRLVASGFDVVGLDTGYYEGCDFLSPMAIPGSRKDIRDITPDDLEGIDAIVHLAALSSDPVGQLTPHLTFAINHAASARLAAIARDAGVRRFLFASSCSVYGKTEEEWVDERSPIAPLTPYATSKARAEQEIVSLTGAAFAPAILRCATVYGVSPRLRLDLVANNLAAWAVTEGRVHIISDGAPRRPLIHIEDLAAAFASLLQLPEVEVRGVVVNVGFEGQNYRVREIAEAVRQVVPGSGVTYASQAHPDLRSYQVRFGLFRSLTGLEPSCDLESGLRRLADAYLSRELSSDELFGSTFSRLNRIRELLDTDRLDSALRWKA